MRQSFESRGASCDTAQQEHPRTGVSPLGAGGFLSRLYWSNWRHVRRIAVVCCVAAVAVITSLALVAVAHSEERQVDAGPVAKGNRAFNGVVKHTSVLVKKSQVVDVDRPYATALIAEAEIADVVPLSDRSIYIVGKKVGSTRLTIVGENQDILRIVEVDVTPDVDDLHAKLNENIPDANIRVTAVNGGIMLSGAVRDAPTIEKALAIAKRYAPEGVTNALSVAAPQQVMLEVRFVEASRSAARELGIGTRGRGPSAAWDTGTQVSDPGKGAVLSAASLLSGAEPFGPCWRGCWTGARMST